MKTSIANALLTSSLLLGLPAFAQDAAAPAPQAPVAATTGDAPSASSASGQPLTPEQASRQIMDSPVFKAYIGVVKDLRPFLSQPSKLKGTVDNIDQFSFSPETKKYLKEVFGNDNPLHFTKTVQSDGGTAVNAVLDSLDYRNETDKGTAHTEPGSASWLLNRDFTRLHSSGSFGGLKFDNGDVHVEVGNVSASGDNVLGPIDIWLGKSEIKLDALTASLAKSQFVVTLSDFDITGDISVHKNLFDIAYDYKIGSIDWGSDKVEKLDGSFALTNVDGKLLQEFLDFARSVDPASADQTLQMEASMKLFKRLGLALAKHAGALEIRNVSAQYHGQTADLKGRISAPNLKQADLDVPQKVYGKLVVKAKLRVPMAMVEDLANRVARGIMEAQSKQSGAQVTDMAVDLVARGMIAKMTDVLVTKQKWAHMEQDVLVTVFEIRKGKLYFDNHVVNPQSNPFMVMARGK